MEIEQVTWGRTTNFTGRNGYAKCNGLDIQPLDHNESVLLAPLTSRGVVGRCDIEVPLEALPEVIAKLQALIARPTEKLVRKAR
jgi:hypothetical protein